MLSRSKNIPLLVGRSSTLNQLDRNQVLAEVASGRINEETPSVGSPDRNVAERAGSGIISLVRLCNRCGLQSAACPRDRNRFGWVEVRNAAVSGTAS